MFTHPNNAFQTIFSFFFQNQNSAGFYKFDLFEWNHSAKKRIFHKKNHNAVYMLRKLMGVISRFWWNEKDKSKTILFVFLRTAIFLQFNCQCKLLKLGDVKKRRF